KVGPLSVVTATFDNEDAAALRGLADTLKERTRDLVCLFGNRTEKGPVLLFLANKGAVEKGVHCGNLIRSAAAVIGGGGGGRPDSAQAGGKDASQLDAALRTAAELIAEAVGGKDS